MSKSSLTGTYHDPSKFDEMPKVETGGGMLDPEQRRAAMAQNWAKSQEPQREGANYTTRGLVGGTMPNAAPTLADVLTERGHRYGKFTGHAQVTQDLKMLTNEHLETRKKTLPADMQEALDMIYHKIGRIINGDHNYADSWVDIAGYAKLVADRLEGVAR